MEPTTIKIVKKITLNIRKVDAFKELRKAFGYTYNHVKEVYTDIINDNYVGKEVYDLYHLISTLRRVDWCDVEIETTIINQDEIDKFNEAKNWLNGLSEDEKEYFHIMGKSHYSLVAAG
jgi:hypothetical protein|tara:strand:+ start:1812 stop:2168 length:357 start_codon:yes stop_codon:yes gene_type:complete